MSTEESPRQKVRADPHRVMAWVDTILARRPVRTGLAGLLVLILAILLGPRLWSKEGIADRLRVGERAEGNLKATRSFDYMPTDEELEAARAEAVKEVLPVFDYQSDLGTVLVARINRAFNSMSPAVLDEHEPPGRGDRRKPNRRQRGGRSDKERGRTPASQPSSTQDELRAQLSEILQAEIPAAEFRILSRTRFSAEARSTLLVMVGSAMNQLLVSHRGVLTPFKDQPILVRHLVGGRLGRGGEEKVTNVNRIKDLQQVRDEMRLQANVHAAKLPAKAGRVILELAQRLVVPNMAFNRGETEARREAARMKVQPRPISVVKGQVIVRDGDPITAEHINIIRAMESWGTGVNVFQEIVGVGFFVLLVLVVLFKFAAQQFRRFYERPRDLVAMAVMLVALVGLTKGVVAAGGGVGRGQDLPVFLYVIPVASGAMLVRLLISAEAAVVFATVVSALCGLLADRSLGMMLFYMVTSLVGAAGVAQVQSRSTILRSGLAAGLAGGALLLGMRLFQGHLVEAESLYSVFAAAAGGVLASFMTLALLPAMEWLFAYTTDVTLLELANLNHPLLRDLILRAPGTYHHSMVVGSLSEAACDAIGANGLLARVASYYHDIGKVKNAVYFAENFKPGDNPHNRLKPSMSALIIRSHVKDTIEMLRQHGVPELVNDTSTQHHGKTLIEFFYHKAAERKDEPEEVREEDYRYPGPKPQTREAGVIMLADGVEAAARSLAEPTEDRLRAVVQRVINGKFTDGQLDHCDLTLRDLHLIAKSFLQVLRGIYHQRPTYPWQGRRDETRRGDESRRDTGRMRAVDRRADETSEGGAEGAPVAEPERRAGDEGGREGRRRKGEKRSKSGPHGKQEAKGKTDGKGTRRREETGKSQRAGGEEGGGEAADAEPAAPDAADQPAGEGCGPEGVEPGSAKETPTESNKDIRRLGLG